MARTAALRAQHDAAEEMIDRIFDGIAVYRDERDAYPLSLKLARLAGILRTHFAMEDQILYPLMIESDHRAAAMMARVFRNELGHLGGQFERFIERWASSIAIAGALRQFEYEAGMLFAAVRDRIHRENRDLYPLAEEVSRRRDGPSPRVPSAAAASSTSSLRISATGSSRLTMPTDWPAITEPPSTSPSITARRSAPAQ